MRIISRAALRNAITILLTEVRTILAALRAIPHRTFVGKPRESLRTPVPIFPEMLSEPSLGRRQTVTVVAGPLLSRDIMSQEVEFRLTRVMLCRWSTPFLALACRTTPLNLLGEARCFPMARSHRQVPPPLALTGRFMPFVSILIPRDRTVRHILVGERQWTCTVVGLS